MRESQTLKLQIGIPEYLRSKGIHAEYKKRFSCPSPRHEDTHPSCVVYHNDYGDYIRCFGCDLHGDIYSLIGELEGINSFKDQFYFLRNFYGRTNSKKSGAVSR